MDHERKNLCVNANAAAPHGRRPERGPQQRQQSADPFRISAYRFLLSTFGETHAHPEFRVRSRSFAGSVAIHRGVTSKLRKLTNSAGNSSWRGGWNDLNTIVPHEFESGI